MRYDESLGHRCGRSPHPGLGDRLRLGGATGSRLDPDFSSADLDLDANDTHCR